MKLPEAERPGERYLKFDVTSATPGQVYVSYQIDGETHEGWYRFGDGLSELVIPIPEKIDGNTIWTIRDVNQAPVTLQSAEIRTVD